MRASQSSPFRGCPDDVDSARRSRPFCLSPRQIARATDLQGPRRDRAVCRIRAFCRRCRRIDRARGAGPGAPAQVRAERAGAGAQRAAVPLRTTLRHHLALVEQGQRHRPQLWPGEDRAPGARHRLLRRRRAWRGGDRAGRRAAARPHDPDGAGPHGRRQQPVQPRAAQTAHRGGHPRRRPRGAGEGQRRAGPGPGRGRDRLPGQCVPGPCAQPARHRTDDVRPGQLRALPPQDLQCQLGHRWREPGKVAVRHDQEHLPDAQRERAVGLQGQRLGDRRPHRRALLPQS